MDPQIRLNGRLNNLLSLGDLYKMADFSKEKLTVTVAPCDTDGKGYRAIVGNKIGFGHFPEHALFAAAQHFFGVKETERTTDNPYDYRTEPTSAELYQQMVDWIS